MGSFSFSLETYLVWVLVLIRGSCGHVCIARAPAATMATTDCGGGGKVAYTVNVDIKGGQNFTSVQKAIDSIPSGNNKWIRILIFPGFYREKVVIGKEKGCIFMEGMKGKSYTVISWGDHQQTNSSATFTADSNNIAVKGITFQNSYGLVGAKQMDGEMMMKPALAVRLYGDRHTFYECNLVGIQDTLWDFEGRHYFKRSSISGAMDFIWGNGQSIYEDCRLKVTIQEPERLRGAITAQGRGSESDAGGFVFKGCTVTGNGKAVLGRAYGPFSRVIFYNSLLSDVVLPQGWDAWNFKGQEDKITYVEANNKGPGAGTSQRVRWLKQMSESQLSRFVTLSYIDQEGWISKLPPGALS